MAIGAHLETRVAAGNLRGAPRHRLHLAAAAVKLTGQSVQALVHNISEDGLLLETNADLAVGETIAILLPHQTEAAAQVVWSSGYLFGCSFTAPLSRAALSAAQLQSAPPQPERSDRSRLQKDEVSLAASAGLETFGARLKRLRLVRKMTLVGLARVVGVSKPTIWKWENDEVRPRQKSLNALCNALGVSERDLLVGEQVTESHAAATPGEPSPRSPLAEDINDCKDRIARSAGTHAENVTITIRF